jgi:hypothetical protein
LRKSKPRANRPSASPAASLLERLLKAVLPLAYLVALTVSLMLPWNG